MAWARARVRAKRECGAGRARLYVRARAGQPDLHLEEGNELLLSHPPPVELELPRAA